MNAQDAAIAKRSANGKGNSATRPAASDAASVTNDAHPGVPKSLMPQ